jgi:hypothetical protein
VASCFENGRGKCDGISSAAISAASGLLRLLFHNDLAAYGVALDDLCVLLQHAVLMADMAAVGSLPALFMWTTACVQALRVDCAGS